VKFFTEDSFREIAAKIFKEGYKSYNRGDMWEAEYDCRDIAKLANELLEKQSQRVYHTSGPVGFWLSSKPINSIGVTHTALLVCIEETENEKCKHNKVILHIHYDSHSTVTCECGAKVEPASWKEVEK
jgi:hypothetical protein